MADEDALALEVASLYSSNSNLTFKDIAEKMGISPSYAQSLLRKSITLLETETADIVADEGLDEPRLDNPGPGAHPGDGHTPGLGEMPILSRPQDPRTGPYLLETAGIGRRVMLTPMDIMIFDLFRKGGFQGDLSDFISDSINYMYDNVRPAERF